MATKQPVRRTRLAAASGEQSDLLAQVSSHVVGQAPAIEAIVPYVNMHRAGLAPEGRPVGVFLLLGPTGTGKTKTVESFANAIHGSEKNLLRIDCGEFQMEHEVAKLIGAPPGYLGHRETVPMLNQQKLNGVCSEHSNLSIVLFDEVEKAAPSMHRLLLGVLDKATLRLGDNTTVNFERSLIFLTSNLGARGIQHELRPDYGFAGAVGGSAPARQKKLAAITLNAVKKKFTPEFVNRVDVISTYSPLDDAALERILDHQLTELRRHLRMRMGARSVEFELSGRARQFLLERGTSLEFGARELRRVVQRQLTQPLANALVDGSLEPGGGVLVDWDGQADRLDFEWVAADDVEKLIA